MMENLIKNSFSRLSIDDESSTPYETADTLEDSKQILGASALTDIKCQCSSFTYSHRTPCKGRVKKSGNFPFYKVEKNEVEIFIFFNPSLSFLTSITALVVMCCVAKRRK